MLLLGLYNTTLSCCLCHWSIPYGMGGT